MGNLVSDRVKFFEAFQSGQKQTFVKATQKFYLQLKMTDPKDPSKLVNMPKGIRVRLMANEMPLKNSGATALTDDQGKVALAPDSATIRSRPDYHFRIDLDERTYIDIDKMQLAPGKSIKMFDDRKLMEIPMVVDTADGGFHYDESKLKLTDGKLKDYDASGKGEGTAGDPVILEVRFYWYHLKFKYFDRIKNGWADVPAGMPIVPRLDANEDYLHQFIVKDFLELDYLLDQEEKSLQHHLNLLGFNCGKVDGIVGPKTRKGIRAFQTHYKLQVDGIAGPITKRTLEQVFYRRTIGIYDGGVYAVPVWKKKSATWADLFFETALPAQIVAKAHALTTAQEASRFDLFLYTKDNSTAPELMHREAIAEKNKDADNNPVGYADLQFPKQRNYYDLPVEWSSRNYWTRYDNSMDKGERYQKVMKEQYKLFPYDADENKRAQALKPLMFSFDDIVLVKAQGSQAIKDKTDTDTPVDLKADTSGKKDGSRLSLFHVKEVTKDGVKSGELVLHAPEEAKKPYFSKVTADSANFTRNVIAHVPGNAMLVAFANDFYAIGNQRAFGTNDLYKLHYATTDDLAFDAGKDIKGCRVAILNNSRVHAGEAIRYTNTSPHMRYFARATGNYDLHYLHQAWPIENGPDGLTIQSFLVVYWNGVFVKKDYIGHVTYDSHGDPEQDPDTAHPMTDADVKTYATEGLTNAKERWELKGYTMEPFTLVKDGGTCKVQVKPVFFFEAKQGGVGGKPKCKVEISNDKDAGSMGITGSWMYYPDYKIRDYLGVGRFTDIDGKQFETLVVSHELGHAEGKDDDYSYSDRFNQYYLGMPYQYDIGSMMNDNRAPRMRNLWNFLNWVNDQTSAPGNNNLKTLVGATEFKLVHRYKKGGADKILNYHLSRTPNDYRDVYKPFKDETNKSVGTGKLDFGLYKLGEDETALNLPVNTKRAEADRTQFDGILAVYLKIAFRFVDSATHNWTRGIKRNWRNSIRNTIKGLNDRFIIRSSSGDHDFKDVYVSFFPVCIESNSGQRHYKVTVTVENPVNGNTLWTVNNENMSIGHNTCEYDVVSYLLGHSRNSLARKRGAPANPSIVKDDLDFIRVWFRDQMGDDDAEVTLIEV